MRPPSGEKKGLALIARFEVSLVSLPLSTSSFQMLGEPEREEKNAIALPSGDQFGWKSPPRPLVSRRVLPSCSE